MKKLLLSILTVGLIGNAYSQCIPDTAQVNNLPSGQAVPIYPAPGTTVGTGDTVASIAGTSYPNILSLYIPHTISGFPIAVDSVELSGIENLPTEITYNCSSANCIFQDSTYGCVIFNGSVSTGSFVNILLKIKVNNIDVSGFGIKPSLWLQTGPLGIEVLDVSKFTLIQNTPNPFSNSTSINFTTPNSVSVLLEVSNSLGQKVHSETIKSIQGINSISFDGSNLSSGSYFFSLSNGEKTLTGKMAIAK